MKAFLSVVAILLLAVAAWAAYDTLVAQNAARPSAQVPEGAEDNDPLANDQKSAGKRAPGTEAALVGEWKSSTDASFTRVFQADGKFYDTYEGDPAGAPGTWQLATDGSEELWLDSEGDRMRFRVVSVSATNLDLVYIGGAGGGNLSFVKVR
jgi:hypothetical protein